MNVEIELIEGKSMEYYNVKSLEWEEIFVKLTHENSHVSYIKIEFIKTLYTR